MMDDIDDLWYALFGKVTRSSRFRYSSSVAAADLLVCFCRVPRGEKVVLMVLANRRYVAWCELYCDSRGQRTRRDVEVTARFIKILVPKNIFEGKTLHF